MYLRLIEKFLIIYLMKSICCSQIRIFILKIGCFLRESNNTNIKNHYSTIYEKYKLRIKNKIFDNIYEKLLNRYKKKLRNFINISINQKF